jgi:hypothetical protein
MPTEIASSTACRVPFDVAAPTTQATAMGPSTAIAITQSSIEPCAEPRLGLPATTNTASDAVSRTAAPPSERDTRRFA